MIKRSYIIFTLCGVSLCAALSVFALNQQVDRFDGTSPDAFDDSTTAIMEKLNDEQIEILDRASALIGYEIQDEDLVADQDKEIDVMAEVRKRLDGKSVDETLLAAEAFLKRNIEFKRAEINQEIDELLQERTARGLEDRNQRKFAYLHEQKEIWSEMKATIKEFNFDYESDLIGANLKARTNGQSYKGGGYLPYETEPDKYSAMYKTLNPDMFKSQEVTDLSKTVFNENVSDVMKRKGEIYKSMDFVTDLSSACSYEVQNFKYGTRLIAKGDDDWAVNSEVCLLVNDKDKEKINGIKIKIYNTKESIAMLEDFTKKFGQPKIVTSPEQQDDGNFYGYGSYLWRNTTTQSSVFFCMYHKDKFRNLAIYIIDNLAKDNNDSIVIDNIIAAWKPCVGA